jgi:TatD DNase family protein
LIFATSNATPNRHVAKFNNYFSSYPKGQVTKIFDSHCHLDDKVYAGDLEAVIQRAHKAGVTRMVTVGTNKKTSAQAVSLAEYYQGIIFASVGVHPHDAGYCSESAISDLAKIAKNRGVIAWGEIGLDFNRMYSPRKDQEKWLIKQLEIADEQGLPIIFHERDSRGCLLEILKSHPSQKRRAAVHCFSGDENELEQYLQLGFFIGITGILTLKERGANLRKLVTRIPANRLLVETDAPYLIPVPEKNHTRRNEPAFVKSVLLKLAGVIKADPEELAQIIWENTNRLYRVD